MIHGYFGGPQGRRRPFVIADVAIPAIGIAGTVHFLVDTGADSTLLAPRDAIQLRIDLARLPPDDPTMGVGGRTSTVSTDATITFDNYSFTIRLRILAPVSRVQQQDLQFIPSLLGRDILSHFALFIEARRDRVLLLEASEANALNLP